MQLLGACKIKLLFFCWSVYARLRNFTAEGAKTPEHKKKKTFLPLSLLLSPTAKVDLLCYWWQNSQCGIRTLSSDNVPESQHGAAFTGGGHTLLSVLPWAKPAEELVINRGTTSGCYCFPYWWRKNIIVQWSLWSSWRSRNVSHCVFESVWTACGILDNICISIDSHLRISLWMFAFICFSPHTASIPEMTPALAPPPLFLVISSTASVPLCCHSKTIECKSSNLLNVH